MRGRMRGHMRRGMCNRLFQELPGRARGASRREGGNFGAVPESRAPVGLNVGILVGTSGAIFVLKPVGKNEVLAKVGSPVPAPVPVCIRLGKNVGLNVGSFVPTPVPEPTKDRKNRRQTCEPLRRSHRRQQSACMAQKRLDAGFCTKPGPSRCLAECGCVGRCTRSGTCGFVGRRASAGTSSCSSSGRDNRGQDRCADECGFVGRRNPYRYQSPFQ